MRIGNTIKTNITFLLCVVFIFVIIIVKLVYVSYAKNVDGISMPEQSFV